MTYAACLAEARELKSIMTKWGVPCSIELVGGRGSDPWALPKKYIRMHHHTAAWYRPGGNLTPTLGLCKKGRSDLTGPLCNGYGGFDRVYRIICMGLANHSGLGGPITIDGVYIPKDSGRGPTWGTEWEGGYQDWAQIPGMLEFMGRADNALAEWSGRPDTSQMEHSTWTSRKIDRLNFNRTKGIALTAQWNGAGKPTPIPPKPPERKTKMLYLVKCNDRPHVFITDWITGRHVWDWKEVDMIRFLTAVGGQPISTAANGQPHVLSILEQKKFIDRIADEAEIDPKYPYTPH